MRTILSALAIIGISATAGFARDVTHALGTTEVPDAPQRVVVLEFSFVDALSAVGLAPVGIADDNKRDRIQSVLTDVIGDDWTSVGTRKTPSLEVIASLQPDLIIADKTRHEAIYDTLGQIAPTVVYDSLTGDYQDVLEEATRIGEAVGRAEEMAEFQRAHAARMEAIRDEVADSVVGRAAQFGVINANGFWLHSPQSYVGSLLDYFGFAPVMSPSGDDSYGELYQQVTLEQASELEPAVLILGKIEGEHTLDLDWADEALWQQIPAVRDGNVFDVSSNLWSRSRGMLTAEATARDIREIAQSLK
ncbi:ABC transporter substrate-binding protein [Salipiger mangrovisoli]|uniref:ABC transporter substrate-binding protein n=1 Tax=Salipiger mangrovisoli TaxID=2865933 RepID=A0ABR9WY52_9RHOB|nr:Fe(3+) dicitrate ABC transporter substrate-binding protein [Salipiger mangrovisoli]MBE9636220.1 ABC transporter substrate-binding protein [Salipiger mangrovisoli]